MRKLDFLRKTIKKLKKESDIFYINLPDAFYKKGDIDPPVCTPFPIDDKDIRRIYDRYDKISLGVLVTHQNGSNELFFLEPPKKMIRNI